MYVQLFVQIDAYSYVYARISTYILVNHRIELIPRPYLTLLTGSLHSAYSCVYACISTHIHVNPRIELISRPYLTLLTGSSHSAYSCVYTRKISVSMGICVYRRLYACIYTCMCSYLCR